MITRPHIVAIRPYTWNTKSREPDIRGLLVEGNGVIAAHVTKTEAYALADWIVDAADKLPEPREPKPCYTRHSDSLTAADGTPEEPLPATSAE